MRNPEPLRAGVLIIGSLLWESRREAWRKARMDMAYSKSVTAPIRYGRLSERRGKTYTMVFSSLCEAGRAKVVRCAGTVSSAEDLIAEAEHLCAAEQNEPVAHSICGRWSCVAILWNPGHSPAAPGRMGETRFSRAEVRIRSANVGGGLLGEQRGALADSLASPRV